MNSTLSLLSVISGLLGSAILAFAVSRILSMLSAAVEMHELTLECMNDPDPAREIPVVVGFDKQIARARKFDAKFLYAGLFLLFASFAFQLAAYMIPVANAAG
ncbi:hypothetical protein CA13_31690 [Planctomycetes bacterium CA13]|uniref:Uncharacterized protein n=1 Tax=Novipirellula herctigrandis TaxID=2527986 RepID=A0A5C5Z3Y8_9BACT|nr:hypothetical protein CA13_31690 [Planctomycetes bacterium CA13]